MTGVFLSVRRYDWCTLLLHPSSCTLVNNGLSQQSSKEEYKPWERDATQDTTHSYKDHVANEEVHAKIQQAIRPLKNLLTMVKRHKLQWYGHVSRSSGLAKTILQGMVKGEEDKEDRGRGGKTTLGNGQAWSSPNPRGQWRTGENGRNWLWNRLWCPNDRHS